MPDPDAALVRKSWYQESCQSWPSRLRPHVLTPKYRLRGVPQKPVDLGPHAPLDRGHEGIREHLRAVIERDDGALE